MFNFPIFNILDDLKIKGYIKNTIIKVRTEKDIEIFVGTTGNKVKFVKDVIEANIYTNRDIDIKNVEQNGEYIKISTNSGKTFKVTTVSKKDLEDIKTKLTGY